MPLTKKGKNLLLGGSMVFMAGSLAWLFLPAFFQDAGKPASQLPVPKVEKKLGDRTGGQPKAPSTPAQKSEGRTGERVQAALNDSGTRLGDLARMRGQKHLLEQEVKIAELQRQLREAQTIAPVVPQPQQEIVLPPLDPPKKEKDEKEDKLKRPAGPVVVSVQGVGNRLSATIRASSGETVTVRHGQRFGGGVLSVTRRSVTIRSGSTSRDIPFME